ncbi:GAF and HD domains-containing protein [Desulfonema magnum]|uniref:GAF and HD domains-containing protein n=2 Tax=Desulfonema magnum TaxID=45655 RepID=A0A975BNV0_9BACT|nr:GAF and HD domains-containing protein [Desulfonema magnum]
MIVNEARAMTRADAGTLYILDKDKKELRAKILQNNSMKIQMGGVKNIDISLPDVPLPNVPLYYKNGEENRSNVSSYAALTGETINIPDVYKAKGFDFTGPRNYDVSTGYRSKSMLVIPLKNHENHIIGVLQLLNAQDIETGEVVAFSSEYVDMIASLASQAAVVLTNTWLIQNLKDRIKRIRKGAEIGKALSVERDISKLLEMIVDEARAMSKADAGTLYILDKDQKYLQVEIFQNDTMKTRMDGAKKIASLPNAPFPLPHVPLYNEKGKGNYSQVSSYVALTGEIVNIPDVYDIPGMYKNKGFDFTGPKNYDKKSGYLSKSMLVIPLKNHENKIIGVLQLLNAQNKSGEVIAFSPDLENLVASLASQAAVALTNNQLIRDLKDALQKIKNLFDAFIKSIATAIEKKSLYTGGHIERVVKLTMMIAKKINETSEGPLKDACFDENEMEELRLAAWMHDIGKITTPQYIMDKATKLEAIVDRIHLIETRFHLIAKSVENRYLQRKIEILQSGKNFSETEHADKKFSNEIKTLYEELEFIRLCNRDFMDEDKIKHLRKIAGKTYFMNGETLPYLTRDEVRNLCVRKGTLTDEEREIIENHATMTWNILFQLPFPRALASVPDYAWAHHEKLDGSGYPQGLSGKDIPLQSRIMVIADIFEALTAGDRPYKKPATLSEAVGILENMKKENKIDPDVYDLFIKEGLYREYAKKQMNPEQLDH